MHILMIFFFFFHINITRLYANLIQAMAKIQFFIYFLIAYIFYIYFFLINIFNLGMQQFIIAAKY